MERFWKIPNYVCLIFILVWEEKTEGMIAGCLDVWNFTYGKWKREAKESDDVGCIQHYEPDLYPINGYVSILITLKCYVKRIILIIFDIQNNDHQKWQESQWLKRYLLFIKQEKKIRTF